MKLTWFGHSAYRLEFGSSVVMIDPFLTGNPVFKGDAEAASAGATHVLLTHGHATMSATRWRSRADRRQGGRQLRDLHVARRRA